MTTAWFTSVTWGSVGVIQESFRDTSWGHPWVIMGSSWGQIEGTGWIEIIHLGGVCKLFLTNIIFLQTFSHLFWGITFVKKIVCPIKIQLAKEDKNEWIST